MIEAFRAALGDRVTDDPGLLDSHARDRAPFAPAGRPALLVRPRTVAEVQAAMEVASLLGVSVVPRGAGSGLSGGANATAGCVVLSTASLRQVREFRPADRLITVEAGLYNSEVKREVAGEGLAYPPDPSSMDFCTIGGNVATNAGGLCCLGYGVTREYVSGLEVVLADGRLLTTGSLCRKSVAGYDLTHLFVGSEGTLGIITAVSLRLVPLATARAVGVAFFADYVAAAGAVQSLADQAEPMMLEFLDRTTLQAVERHQPLGIPADAAAMLLVGTEPASDSSDAGGAADQLAAVLGDHDPLEHAVAADDETGQLLLQARRLAGPAIDETYGTNMVDDVSVPPSRFMELVVGIKDIERRRDMQIPIVGHAGDGNLHPSIVHDDSPDGVAAARGAFDEIIELALGLEGTITGEHGVGSIKQAWLEREVGDVSLSVHRSIKQALDPDGLLNPGKVLRATRVPDTP